MSLLTQLVGFSGSGGGGAGNYKILGQVAPAAATDSVIYTATSTAVCYTLSVCNRGAGATYRVAVVKNGETLSDKHYVVYDDSLNTNESVFLSIGMTLGTGDKIYVRANTASLSFSLFGAET